MDLPNSPGDNRQRAIEVAQKAVALDRDDAGAHCTLGRIRYLCREYAAAISELELALDLNPSLALAHYGLGAAFVFSGRPHDAFPHLESAIRLSPQDPNMGSYLVRIAEAKYLIGDDEAAVRFALTRPGTAQLSMVPLCGSHRCTGPIGTTGRGPSLSRRSDPDETGFLNYFRADNASVRPRHGDRSLLRGTPQSGCTGRRRVRRTNCRSQWKRLIRSRFIRAGLAHQARIAEIILNSC